MKYDRSDARCEIYDALKADGYKIVEQQSDIADPFHWSIVAVKGEYEIRVEERARPSEMLR
jgi:hypothetical protein